MKPITQIWLSRRPHYEKTRKRENCYSGWSLNKLKNSTSKSNVRWY